MLHSAAVTEVIVMPNAVRHSWMQSLLLNGVTPQLLAQLRTTSTLNVSLIAIVAANGHALVLVRYKRRRQ